ncbi:MAG: VOC family protein [Candidatus Diapherotrites archaeon]
MANPVVHFEVPVRKAKINKVRRFYEDVFGWKIEKVKGMDYWMVHTDKTDPKTGMLQRKGMINGGLMKRRMEKGPVIVLQVNNVKNHIRKAEGKGAKILMPATPMGEMGIYARVQDPDGNMIGLWQTTQIKKR